MQRELNTSQTFRTQQQSGAVNLVQRALEYDRIEEDDRAAVQVIKHLKKARFFGPARQYCALARKKFPDRVWFGQQHALCTYKDPDLPLDTRLSRGLAILEEVDPLVRTTSPETLGLAGAIYKNKWFSGGRRTDLDLSASYYMRGYEFELKSDGFPPDRYAGINAAYVLDLLAGADRAHSEAVRKTSAELWRQSREIRREIRKVSIAAWEDQTRQRDTRQWWFLVTLAEAAFGLGVDENGAIGEASYDEARGWIAAALACEHADWELETFARQLAAIGRLHESAHPNTAAPVKRTLAALFPPDSIKYALEGLRAGKTGIALSGGGFRASLFHIGVLARLAELDALRHIEVISCVSGGSIIGTYYYLEVRALLESKPDALITREDYVGIIDRMEVEFLQGVQSDFRNTLFSDRKAAVEVLRNPEYSHTRRLGELFEERLYSRVKDGNGAAPRYLNQLQIRPEGERADFAPKVDNWRRAAKAPILILNATTLNTGHNWQFTTSWMGEPPTAINTEIDANHRLRRLYYWQAASPEYQNFRLGYAVAASAAVPGLFDPLNINGLHKDQKTLLSDGGVHDNQGLSALIGEDCSILLISDASGQLTSQAEPANGRLGVIQRTNEVLQERIRGVEYREILARLRARAIRSLMFIHLTKDLDRSAVPWHGDVPAAEPPDVRAEPRDQFRTNYNVLRSVQHALARMRTDLDAFTDDEAHALMLSGYRMTFHEFGVCVPDYPAPPREHFEEWRFQRLREVMAKPGNNDAGPLLESLKGGDAVTGKLIRLLPQVWARTRWLVWIAAAEVCAILILAGMMLWRWPGPVITAGIGGAIVIGTIVVMLVWIRGVMRRGKSVSRVLLCTMLRCGGARLFDTFVRELTPLYLAAGRANPVAFDPSSTIAKLRNRIGAGLAALGIVLAALVTAALFI